MKTTRNRRNTCKRVLAMLTALAMSFSMLQSVAFADDLTGGGENEPAVIADTEPNTNDPSDSTGGNDTTNESGDPQTPPADGETPQEPADEVVPPFPVDGTAEEQQAWYEKYTNRDDQSETVDTIVGIEKPNEDGKEPSEGEEPGETPDAKNWNAFYDAENDTYKLTFEIGEDAKGDQTIDLTYALELLGEYAKHLEETNPGSSVTSYSKDEVIGIWDKAPDNGYPQDMVDLVENQLGMSIEDFDSELMWGGNSQIWGLFAGVENAEKATIRTAEDLIKVYNEIPDPADYPEELKNLADWQGWRLDVLQSTLKSYSEGDMRWAKGIDEYLKGIEAGSAGGGVLKPTTMEPGDIRHFEIFLTSKSGHTYKYKDGSFTLATPELDTTPSGEGDIYAFDGQVLPEEYLTRVLKYYQTDEGELPISRRSEPILRLLVDKIGMREDDVRYESGMLKGQDSSGSWQSDMWYTRLDQYLNETYGTSNMTDGITAYLLDYYHAADKYTTLTELIENNEKAHSDLVLLGTDGNINYWLRDKNDKPISHSAAVKNVMYNQFYQYILSFAYGDDVNGITGGPKLDEDGNPVTHKDGSWSYNNVSWTSVSDMKLALDNYMAHKGAWEAADTYFKDLLSKGLTAEEASWKAFHMALNIDGELAGDAYQITKWKWYNSIKLEQVDYNFELVKTDENGEPIKSNATAFQLWYVNGDGEKVYFTQNEDGEFVETTDSNAVVKTNEEGKLSSLYTLMKDKIYYLQEAEAPDGYVIDPTVYVLTDSADKIDEEKLRAEANAKKEALEKDLNTLLESAPDYAASSEKFQELKEKIDAYLAADGKTGTDTAAYADELQAQLNALKANDMSIGELSAALGSTKDQVQADIDAFEAKREELSNLYNSASSRIDALNSSLQAEYDAFNAVKARYEASTDPAERAALRDQMTASQLEAQRLTAEMSAVKSAYDSSSLHTEYAALQAAAQGSLSSYNGYKSALDSITSTQEYQDLKERLETLQALKDAKAEMDGHASAAEIAELNKQIALAENQTFKLIADLTESKNADWLKNLSLSVSFKNQKEIEEKDFEVLLPDEFGSLSMSGSFNSPLPDGMEFTFDVPDPDPTPDPDPDPDPTPDPDPDPDPTPIPDPPVPLTPTPDTTNSQLPPPNAPSTPDVPDTTPIPDVDVPLADAPEVEEPVEELVEIPEEEVPLGNPDVPKTGDISGVWYTMTLLAAAGLVFITILERKKQQAAQEN